MIILSTGSLYTYGVARVFELAAEVGFDGLEVLIDHRPDSYHVDYLRRLAETNALPIMALHVPFQFVSAWPQGQLAYLQTTVGIAQALSVPTVVMHLPFRISDMLVRWQGFLNGSFRVFLPWSRHGSFYRFILDGQLSRLEAESGVAVAIENMPRRSLLGLSMPLYWFNRPRELVRFSHLTLDTTHIGTWGWDLLDVYEQLKARIVHVHLSNYDGQEHRLPMNGQLPLDELLRRLARDGFRGTISVECGPDAFEAQDEAGCKAALRRVLGFCREYYG